MKRIIDRLRGILGRDCDGAPIRVGSRVRIVGPGVISSHLGRVCVVLGPQGSLYLRDGVEIDLPHPSARWNYYDCCCQKLKVLNDKPDEASDWNSVEKETGWHPGKVRETPQEPVEA